MENSNTARSETGWLTKERMQALVLIVTTAIFFYLCYLLAKPFLASIAWAVALTVLAYPLHNWISSRIKKESLAALLTVTIVTLTIVAPILFVTQQMILEATRGATILREWVKGDGWKEFYESNAQLQPYISLIEEQVNLADVAQQAAGHLTEFVSLLVSGSVVAVIEILITIFALYYFVRDRTTIMRALRSVIPLSRPEADRIFRNVGDTIYGTVYGTLVVAVLQGVLGGLIFWWLGVPGAILWGAVMGLLAIVPILGAFIVWVPVAIFFIISGDWTKALILTAWGAVVIGLIDNLLYPVLVGKRIRLHTLPVFFSILGGLALFGTSGLILGPVILAVTNALIEIWRHRTAGGHTADEPPDTKTAG